MRTFVTVSHTAAPDGAWQLNDLPGTGRIDVVCRNIQAALFTSHGIREDTNFIAVFHADSVRPRAVCIQGGAIKHLNPDERSTAARLQQALAAATDDPWWETVQNGLLVAPFNLEQVLADTPGTSVLLHKDGEPLADAPLPENPVFVLGDHQPLTDDEEAAAGQAKRISLGDSWLHGNQVICVVQWMADRA